MKKFFVLSFALLAALVACNKDQIVPENNDAPAASFTATIAPDTKISFSSDGQANESFTTAFDGHECVYLWTKGAANNRYTLFNATTPSGKQCVFNISTNSTYVVTPASSNVDFGAILTSYNCMGYTTGTPYLRFGYNKADETFLHQFSFAYGNGTRAQATTVQALFATGTYTGTYPDLTFSYLTSILKVDVNLPDGSGANLRILRFM